ncbi:GyrI-like domain-containing protein [Tenacibaculum sp. M341]|uniref:GyrI-like domain-containing protein n=1 Tax=Tenacibaculum sp. M341 TaxID=2530339 RepID=UPI0010500DA2|nr:GyrI-like domain-containing protein [Tenacibaculum sp. M341]TCI89960.1 AraC family transcriptional regulator [Tenacibaculum sp. M341]
MKTIQKENLKIIGISVRTTNQNQQAAKDIPALWEQFVTTNVIDKIPNKLDGKVFSVYTDYESDYMGSYTTILGCEVSSLENVPEGMTTVEIPADFYTNFTINGQLNENIVYNKWLEIWQSDIKRSYHSDFEVYEKSTLKEQKGTVNIYIATEKVN